MWTVSITCGNSSARGNSKVWPCSRSRVRSSRFLTVASLSSRARQIAANAEPAQRAQHQRHAIIGRQVGAVHMKIIRSWWSLMRVSSNS